MVWGLVGVILSVVLLSLAYRQERKMGQDQGEQVNQLIEALQTSSELHRALGPGLKGMPPPRGSYPLAVPLVFQGGWILLVVSAVLAGLGYWLKF